VEAWLRRATCRNTSRRSSPPRKRAQLAPSAERRRSHCRARSERELAAAASHPARIWPARTSMRSFSTSTEAQPGSAGPGTEASRQLFAAEAHRSSVRGSREVPRPPAPAREQSGACEAAALPGSAYPRFPIPPLRSSRPQRATSSPAEVSCRGFRYFLSPSVRAALPRARRAAHAQGYRRRLSVRERPSSRQRPRRRTLLRRFPPQGREQPRRRHAHRDESSDL